MCPGCTRRYQVRSFVEQPETQVGDYLICGYCLSIFRITVLDPLQCRLLTAVERAGFLATSHGQEYFQAVKSMADIYFQHDSIDEQHGTA